LSLSILTVAFLSPRQVFVINQVYYGMSVLLTAGKLVLLYSDRRMIEFVNY